MSKSGMEETIKVQNAFMQARAEYKANEEERKKRIAEQAKQATQKRLERAEERKALLEKIKNDPELMKMLEGHAFEVGQDRE